MSHAKNSKDLQNFDNAWKALNTEIQYEVREKIMHKCRYKTINRFNDRRTGRVSPREFEAINIINVFAEYGINAITGEAVENVI